jgi:hypothetical protein
VNPATVQDLMLQANSNHVVHAHQVGYVFSEGSTFVAGLPSGDLMGCQ